MDIGILGCGSIGRALAKGLKGRSSIGRIVATTRSKRPHVDLPGGISLKDNRELASVSDVVVFCVKPVQMEEVVREIAPDLREGTLLVSVAAGVSTRSFYHWTDGRFPVVRAMPNAPCRIGSGITALAAAFSIATDEHIEIARDLFSALGRVVVVEEPQMDAVTGLSGCGPAYVYLIIEALADAGVSLGLPRSISLDLAAKTLQGSAELVLASHLHPASLKDEVATPGGCTIDGLLALESGLLRSTLVGAVTAAAARSAALGYM